MRVNPKISVVVPSFNREGFLSRCIRSLLNQIEPADEFEIIVVDDGSTDGSSEVLASFSDQIRVARNSANQGLSASLNHGLSLARGEYVVRVDSDDYVNRYFLSCLRSFLELNEDANSVAVDYIVVDESETVLYRESAEKTPIGCGIMFQTDHVLDLGGYNVEFRAHEDVEFRARYEERFSISYLRIPLYRYRRHHDNLTNDATLMEYYAKKLRHSSEESVPR